MDPKVLLDAIFAGSAKPAAAAQQPPAGGGLGDLLRQLGQAAGGGQPVQPGQSGQSAQPPQSAGGGGLGDILGQVLAKAGLGGPSGGQPGAGGSVTDILGQIFGQAKQGVSEGAGRVDEAIGARQKLDEVMRQVTGGKGTPETIEKLKELVANNQLGAGAVLGGLGALVLGTKSGRGVATDAAKLGGLVLIGGLAYKAYQNYTQGKPVLGDQNKVATPAPKGSGYEPAAQSGDHALLYVRAMIAAAAADGQIDAGEQQRILGGLSQMGLGAESTQFLKHEVANPASVKDLVAGSTSPETAVQVYSAARLAIEPHAPEERAFLAELAAGLGIDTQLAAHIDAEASKVKV